MTTMMKYIIRSLKTNQPLYILNEYEYAPRQFASYSAAQKYLDEHITQSQEKDKYYIAEEREILTEQQAKQILNG